jgi:hypothetical protein
MNHFAKILLIGTSAVAALAFGAFLLAGLVDDSGNTMFIMGWIMTAIFGAWLVVAPASALVIVITAKADTTKATTTNTGKAGLDQANQTGKRSTFEWVFLALLFYLSFKLLGLSFPFDWLILEKRWDSWLMLRLVAGLIVFVSAIALLMKYKQAIQFLLVAVIALFVESNYLMVFTLFKMPFASLLINLVISNVVAMMVLAGYIHLKRRQSIA